MKFRAIIFILAVVVVLTGCSNGSKSENNVTLVTLDKVVQAIHAQGPELIALTQNGESTFDAINGVQPYRFTIANATEDVAHPERIYVYIFDSEQARKEGQSEINGKFTVTTLTAIGTYEQKNVLVVYFATNGKLDKFDDKIQKALQKL